MRDVIVAPVLTGLFFIHIFDDYKQFVV